MFDQRFILQDPDENGSLSRKKMLFRGTRVAKRTPTTSRTGIYVVISGYLSLGGTDFNGVPALKCPINVSFFLSFSLDSRNQDFARRNLRIAISASILLFDEFAAIVI